MNRKSLSSWISVLLTVLAFVGVTQSSKAQGFEDVDLGGLDPGSLVWISGGDIELLDIATIDLNLPADLDGEEPILLLLIDPDGDPLTDDSFPLPIDISALLTVGGDGLLSLDLSLLDQVISTDDLELIDGLDDLLDGLLGGLLGDLLGDDLTVLGLAEELVYPTLEAIGIDAGGTVDYILKVVIETIGGDTTVIAEAEPITRRPDSAVGPRAARNTHRGNNRYSGGAGQILRQRIPSNRIARSFFSLENDGNDTDQFSVLARGSSERTFRFRAFRGGKNRTGAVKTGRLKFTLAPGQSTTVVSLESFSRREQLRARTNPRRNPVVARRFMTLRSMSDPSQFDTAETRTLFLPR